MKKCIALILALTMLMSFTPAFAKTTETWSLEEMSFEEAVKEADKAFDTAQKEVEVFDYLSDYAKIDMAMKLMNISISSGLNQAENEDDIDRLAKRAREHYDIYDPVNVLEKAKMQMQNAYTPNYNELSAYEKDLVNDIVNGEFTKYMDDIENEITKMAESKYKLTTPEKNINIVFSDVNEESWYYEAVTEMTAMGLFNGKTEHVNGVGTFAPDDIITEVEFLAILCRMIFDGVEPEAESKWYAMDMHGNKTEIETPWYGDYFTILLKNDVSLPLWGITGVSAADTISRGNMATLIARAIHVSRCWSDTLYDDMKKDMGAIVADYEKVDEWDEAGVKVAYHEGIMVGDDKGRLKPDSYATRAEAAVVLYRLYNLLKSNDIS